MAAIVSRCRVEQPEQPLLPAYGRRSLAELTPVVAGAVGAPYQANPLGIEPARRVCLLLVDGLGSRQLTEFAADAPFLAGLAAANPEPMTAGFPSSTPVSLASLGTGAPTGAHGMLGLSFEAGHGELLDALSGRPTAAASSSTSARISRRSGCSRCRPHWSGRPRRHRGAGWCPTSCFNGSGLTRAALRGGEYRGVHALGDLAAELITALRSPGPGFVYGYTPTSTRSATSTDRARWPGGCSCPPSTGSPPWSPRPSLGRPAGGHRRPRDGHRARREPDRRRLRADPAPGRAVARRRRPLPHVYAKPGAADDVLAAWRERLGELAWVRSREEAVEAGWFGPVRGTEALRRIGDVVVAMRGEAAVVADEGGEVPATLVGQHGSLTAAEQEIPLLLHRGD